MHGVPADLPLARFLDHSLNRICLGRSQLQFHFAGAGSIQIEAAGWEVRTPGGEVVDARELHADREAYRLHCILDLTVARFAVDPPRSFTLFFESGHCLTIYDDSPRYESFSIAIEGESSLLVV
jgi:hypothetical protein